MIKSYLTENEENELRKLAQNPVLVNALEKLLLEELYHQGIVKDDMCNPLENAAFYLVSRVKAGQVNKSDAEIGADLRAMWEGINILKNGLKELDKFKQEEVPAKKEPNRAR